MGTRFELVLEDGDRAAGEAALEVVEYWDQRLSAFRRDSLVMRINVEARSHPVPLDAETHSLFETCLEIGEATRWAFNVGFPRRAFKARSPGFRTEGNLPLPASFASQPFALRDSRLRLPLGVFIDLGAIGKGFALDRAAEELRGAGVRRALLHGGTSSTLAIGAPPGRDGWGVAIKGADGEADHVVSLRDRALAVSASGGQVDERGGHVLDPRTGLHTQPGAMAAVTSHSATLADAWSTALVVFATRGVSLPDYPPDISLVIYETAQLL